MYNRSSTPHFRVGVTTTCNVLLTLPVVVTTDGCGWNCSVQPDHILWMCTRHIILTVILFLMLNFIPYKLHNDTSTKINQALKPVYRLYGFSMKAQSWWKFFGASLVKFMFSSDATTTYWARTNETRNRRNQNRRTFQSLGLLELMTLSNCVPWVLAGASLCQGHSWLIVRMKIYVCVRTGRRGSPQLVWQSSVGL